jgi:hypothetical protein
MVQIISKLSLLGGLLVCSLNASALECSVMCINGKAIICCIHEDDTDQPQRAGEQGLGKQLTVFLGSSPAWVECREKADDKCSHGISVNPSSNAPTMGAPTVGDQGPFQSMQGSRHYSSP